MPVCDVNHGASCCGIVHIYNFYDNPSWESADPVVIKQRVVLNIEELDRALKREPRKIRHGRSHYVKNERACEIVLTDYQLEMCDGMLLKAIEERGFHRVVRFQNPNSNQFVNIFYRTFTMDGKEQGHTVWPTKESFL